MIELVAKKIPRKLKTYLTNFQLFGQSYTIHFYFLLILFIAMLKPKLSSNNQHDFHMIYLLELYY